MPPKSKKQPKQTEEVSHEELINQRLEELNAKYRAQVLGNFLAKNQGPKLDKIIEYVKLNENAENEIHQAADRLNQATQKYLETGTGMDELFTMRAAVDALEDKLMLITPLPKDHKELFAEYRSVLSVRSF